MPRPTGATAIFCCRSAPVRAFHGIGWEFQSGGKPSTGYDGYDGYVQALSFMGIQTSFSVFRDQQLLGDRQVIYIYVYVFVFSPWS